MTLTDLHKEYNNSRDPACVGFAKFLETRGHSQYALVAMKIDQIDRVLLDIGLILELLRRDNNRGVVLEQLLLQSQKYLDEYIQTLLKVGGLFD